MIRARLGGRHCKCKDQTHCEAKDDANRQRIHLPREPAEQRARNQPLDRRADDDSKKGCTHSRRKIRREPVEDSQYASKNQAVYDLIHTRTPASGVIARQIRSLRFY